MEDGPEVGEPGVQHRASGGEHGQKRPAGGEQVRRADGREGGSQHLVLGPVHDGGRRADRAGGEGEGVGLAEQDPGPAAGLAQDAAELQGAAGASGQQQYGLAVAQVGSTGAGDVGVAGGRHGHEHPAHAGQGVGHAGGGDGHRGEDRGRPRQGQGDAAPSGNGGDALGRAVPQVHAMSLAGQVAGQGQSTVTAPEDCHR
jgi:hypothetical protein